MTIHIRSVTTAQFIRILMATVRHRRRMYPQRYVMSIPQLADVAGWNSTSINYWELGYQQPTMQQALDCLGGTV